MPIRAKRDLTCKKCGKPFSVMMNDAVMPEEVELLRNPICKKCSKTKRGDTTK